TSLGADGYVEERIPGTAIDANTAGVRNGRLFLKDHLGSVIGIVDEAGQLQQRMSYDAWGRRRNIDGSDDSWATLGTIKNDQDNSGYTGHEQLDQLGLVHMNARLYDPMTGRHVSADPTVPDPKDQQAFNRFSYVLNNALIYTDPTGLTPVPFESLTNQFSDFQFDSRGWGCVLPWKCREEDKNAKPLPDQDEEGKKRKDEKKKTEQSGKNDSPIATAAKDLAGWRAEAGGFEPQAGFPTPNELVESRAAETLERLIDEGKVPPEWRIIVAGFGAGVIVESTGRGPQIGPNWKPRDISDPVCRSGCERVARQIQKHVNGKIARIEPKDAPMLGPFRGKDHGWVYHEVVVKDGRVYDLTTGHKGLSVEEYKSLWKYKEAIKFNF
ncbi:hypothetical protein CDN99_25665, partial [Roseateles aquatilis]